MWLARNEVSGMPVYWWCPVCGMEPSAKSEVESGQRTCEDCGAARPSIEFQHAGPTCLECTEVGNDPGETADAATFRIRCWGRGEIDVCNGHFLIHLDEQCATGLVVLGKY